MAFLDKYINYLTKEEKKLEYEMEEIENEIKKVQEKRKENFKNMIRSITPLDFSIIEVDFRGKRNERYVFEYTIGKKEYSMMLRVFDNPKETGSVFHVDYEVCLIKDEKITEVIQKELNEVIRRLKKKLYDFARGDKEYGIKKIIFRNFLKIERTKTKVISLDQEEKEIYEKVLQGLTRKEAYEQCEIKEGDYIRLVYKVQNRI